MRRSVGIAVCFAVASSIVIAQAQPAPAPPPAPASPAPPPSVGASSEGVSVADDGAFEEQLEPFPGPNGPGRRDRTDGGTIAPACEGAKLRLLAAVVDPRCAVTEREWRDLVRAHDAQSAGVPPPAGANKDAGRGGPGGGALRQEARREGDAIILSIVNRGTTPLVVPLRYHPAHPELAFSVLAEASGRGLFELEPPKNDAPEGPPARTAARMEVPSSPTRPPPLPFELDGGASSSFIRVHSARIRLPPGGSASARLVVDPLIAKRLDRTCPDPVTGGDASTSECLPARLPKGATVLHVGQMVAGIDAGEPARVAWDAP